MARRLGHAENPRVARHMEKLPLVSHDQGRLGSRRQGWQVRRCRRRSADLLVQQLRSAKMAHLRGGSRHRHAVGQDGIAFRIPEELQCELFRRAHIRRHVHRGRRFRLYGRAHQRERVQLDNVDVDRVPFACPRDRRDLRAQLRLEKPVDNGRARRQRRHDRAGQRRGLEQRDMVNRLSQGLIEIRHDAVDVVVPVRVHLCIDVQI